MHSAFVFGLESHISQSNINGALVPPAALLTILQKGLMYTEVEWSVGEDGEVGRPVEGLSLIDAVMPEVKPKPASIKSEPGKPAGEGTAGAAGVAGNATGVKSEIKTEGNVANTAASGGNANAASTTDATETDGANSNTAGNGNSNSSTTAGATGAGASNASSTAADASSTTKKADGTGDDNASSTSVNGAGANASGATGMLYKLLNRLLLKYYDYLRIFINRRYYIHYCHSCC